MPNLVLNRSRYNLNNPMQTAGGKYDLNEHLYAWYQFSENISSLAAGRQLKDKSLNFKDLLPKPPHGGTDPNDPSNTLIHTHRPGFPEEDNPGNDIYSYVNSQDIKLFLTGEDVLTRVSTAGGFSVNATPNITTEISTIRNKQIRVIKGTEDDDHVFINDHENLNFPSTSDFSMSLWVYHDSTEQNESELVAKGVVEEMTSEWAFEYSPGKYFFTLFDNNNGGFILKEISSGNLTNGWHHWFITNGSVDDLSDFNVFIDGQPAPAASVTDGEPNGDFETTRNLGGNLYIGRTLQPTFKVADVALWNRIVPDYTIEKIYNSYFHVSKKVPQGFSEKSSMFSDTILQYAPDTNRFSFVDNDGDQSFSISAWIKPSDKNINRNQTIAAKTAIAKDNQNNDVLENAEWRLFLDTNGNMVFRVTSPNDASFKQVLIPSSTVDDYRASWTNVIATYNPNKPSPEIYINGSIKGTPTKTSNSFTGMTKSGANMTIGALDTPTRFSDGEEIGDTDLDNDQDFDDAVLCNSMSQSFSGLILEIAFWKTELDAANVNALYKSYEQSYLVRGDSGATQIGFNISGEVFDEQRQGINIRDINDQTTSLFTKIRPISDDIKTFRYKDLDAAIYNDEIATTSYSSNTSYQRYDLLNQYLDNFGKKYSHSAASSLVAWFKMGVDSASDRSGNLFPGNYMGGTFSDDFIWPLGNQKYKAIVLNGVSDRGVEIGRSVNWRRYYGINTPGDISISAMIKPEKLDPLPSERARIVSICESIGLTIDYENNHARFFYRYKDSYGVWRTPNGVFDFSNNRWYHVLATYSAGNISNTPEIYIDGVKTTLTRLVEPSGERLELKNTRSNIGRKSGGSLLYSGEIADVALWSRKISEEDVEAIFQSIKVGIYNSDVSRKFISRVSVGGAGNLSSRVSHRHEDLNLGQSLLYEDSLPYFDNQEINPEKVIKIHPSNIELPPTLADYNSLSSFDGVVDVINRRKYIDRSTIEQPFRAKGVRGSFGAVDDTYRRSAEIFSGYDLDENQVVENFLDSPGQIHLSTAQLNGGANLTINTPGFAEEQSDTFGKIAPFHDVSSDRDKDYQVFLDDEALRNVLINSDSSKINNYRTHDKMSATGREYDNSAVGVDSFAFGGLKK